MTNPLIAPWTGDHALPPFTAIRDEDFAPAFEAALAEARAAVAAIAASTAAPDFANTIEALEMSQETLSRVAGVFYNLVGADSTPAREALQRDLAPKMAAFASEVTMNPALFARVDALIPMYAVMSDVKTPSTNVIAIQMSSVNPRTMATTGVTSRIARSWRERSRNAASARPAATGSTRSTSTGC